MEHATVSVVIPCYGQAHFLREAIESVIAQVHPTEIVVVDDGSPDNTAEVAARYPQVRYVRQENKGLAEARNSGFRVATGDYLMFLDADDRLTPNAVEAHLDCFVKDPRTGIVVGDIDHISADGSPMEESPRWPVLEANFYEELLRVNHVANTIAVMFRREVIAQVGGFSKAYTPAEDYYLLLRAATCFPARTIAPSWRSIAVTKQVFPVAEWPCCARWTALWRTKNLSCREIRGLNGRIGKACTIGVIISAESR